MGLWRTQANILIIKVGISLGWDIYIPTHILHGLRPDLPTCTLIPKKGHQPGLELWGEEYRWKGWGLGIKLPGIQSGLGLATWIHVFQWICVCAVSCVCVHGALLVSNYGGGNLVLLPQVLASRPQRRGMWLWELIWRKGNDSWAEIWRINWV